MGAWGYGPWGNDSALDWIGGEIESPIAGVIEKTLKKFLKQKFDRPARKTVPKGRRRLPPTGRPGGHEKAIAACALLNELTPYQRANKAEKRSWPRWGRLKGTRLSINHEAEGMHLFSLAVPVLKEILRDPYIENWRDPSLAKKSVKKLLWSLERKVAFEREKGKRRSRPLKGWGRRHRPKRSFK